MYVLPYLRFSNYKMQTVGNRFEIIFLEKGILVPVSELWRSLPC